MINCKTDEKKKKCGEHTKTVYIARFFVCTCVCKLFTMNRGVATIVSWFPRNPPPGAAEKIGQGSPIIEIKQPCPSFHARGCK